MCINRICALACGQVFEYLTGCVGLVTKCSIAYMIYANRMRALTQGQAYRICIDRMCALTRGQNLNFFTGYVLTGFVFRPGGKN